MEYKKQNVSKSKEEISGSSPHDAHGVQNILKMSYTVRSYEVDAQGNLSIISVCNFLQEAAGFHARELGLAMQYLLNDNYTWVLSRMVIRMNEYPGWGENIQVYTWPSGIEKLFAYRDFRITDKDNHTIGTAATSWIVIDARTRRPVRIKHFLDTMNIDFSDYFPAEKPEKLLRPERYDFEKRFAVRYRDIDVNQHVNNTSYIEWISESMSAEVYNSNILTELHVNFLAETYLGDHVIAGYQTQNDYQNIFLHGIIREQDGQELVRCKTVWK